MFYADKLVVMGNSKNLRVFNFAILLKSRKFDACKIYMFFSMLTAKVSACCKMKHAEHSRSLVSLITWHLTMIVMCFAQDVTLYC